MNLHHVSFAAVSCILAACSGGTAPMDAATGTDAPSARDVPTATDAPHADTATPLDVVSPVDVPSPVDVAAHPDVPASDAGSAWPSASTTGVPPGTTLTPYTGPCHITVAGTVIENARIACEIRVSADNVTIRNSSIVPGDYDGVLIDDPYTGTLITHVEISDHGNMDNSGGVNNAGSGAMEVSFCNIHDTADGIDFGASPAFVHDNFIHALQNAPGQHDDGIQSAGGPTSGTIMIVHNTLQPDLGSTGTSSANSAIFATGWLHPGDPGFIPISNMTLRDNLFGGGGWTAYIGDEVAGNVHITVTGNRWDAANAGGYGPVASWHEAASNVWTDNAWTDGRAIAEP